MPAITRLSFTISVEGLNKRKVSNLSQKEFFPTEGFWTEELAVFKWKWLLSLYGEAAGLQTESTASNFVLHSTITGLTWHLSTSIPCKSILQNKYRCTHSPHPFGFYSLKNHDQCREFSPTSYFKS